ncbi:MAG: signal peptidase I [Planctomycetes bacterium]|nr:signal peptidase I [Planctomycetota bacterium]
MGARREPGIRNGIDGLASAVIFLVLMKYFAAEAYVIPSASMQPTLIGSPQSGVQDRVLVDKTAYLAHGPRRWDVAAFRHPLRATQDLVKRVVGLPGETISIAGGNLHRVGADGEDVLRRPAELLRAQWREVFPARARRRGEERLLGASFVVERGEWQEKGGGLSLRQDGADAVAALRFADASPGGLVDDARDGLPDQVVDAGVAATGPNEAVQDVRAQLTVGAASPGPALSIELAIERPGHARRRFELAIAAGHGVLIAADEGGPRATSDPFDVPLAGGASCTLRFTHVDDECVAELGGREVARLDCRAFRTRDALVPDAGGGTVVLRIAVHGAAELRIAAIRIDRDVHYRASCIASPAPTRFTVPADRYFVLGDEPRNSIDSRDWAAITVGATSDGRLVDPRAHADAVAWKGALRTVASDRLPEVDENPIFVPGASTVLFTDTLGESHALRGEQVPNPHVEFIDSLTVPWLRGADGDWQPEIEFAPFVPRAAFLGRVVFVFWPTWPAFRLGVVR